VGSLHRPAPAPRRLGRRPGFVRRAKGSVGPRMWRRQSRACHEEGESPLSGAVCRERRSLVPEPMPLPITSSVPRRRGGGYTIVRRPATCLVPISPSFNPAAKRSPTIGVTANKPGEIFGVPPVFNGSNRRKKVARRRRTGAIGLVQGTIGSLQPGLEPRASQETSEWERALRLRRDPLPKPRHRQRLNLTLAKARRL
jgi:hypothetical protein